jgi:hypothetical protein
MSDILLINGSAPDVSVNAIQREATILNGENAGQLKNGNMIRDVIGTIYNYAMEVTPKMENLAAYDSLYETITAPVDSFLVGVPFGQGMLEFDAYVSNVDDALRYMNLSLKLWDKFAFTAIAMEPQRYYGETWSVGSGSGNQVFTIDGVGFDVSVVSLERTGKVQTADASGRSISGVMGREVIGTYYNYALKLEQNISNPEEYDRLYYALTAPVDSHLLALPYGQNTLTFQAYITRANDQLIHSNDNINVWGSLEIDFMAMAPARR